MKKCEWCGAREVEFQLVLYYLKKELEATIPKSNRESKIQYIRNGLYLQVQLCEKCLPCVGTYNAHKYKLRGNEIQQPQVSKNK